MQKYLKKNQMTKIEINISKQGTHYLMEDYTMINNQGKIPVNATLFIIKE